MIILGVALILASLAILVVPPSRYKTPEFEWLFLLATLVGGGGLALILAGLSQ